MRNARRRVVRRVIRRKRTSTESVAVTAAVSMPASIQVSQPLAAVPARSKTSTAGSASTDGANGVTLTGWPSRPSVTMNGRSPKRSWRVGK